jgi:hypothetical protein
MLEELTTFKNYQYKYICLLRWAHSPNSQSMVNSRYTDTKQISLNFLFYQTKCNSVPILQLL